MVIVLGADSPEPAVWISEVAASAASITPTAPTSGMSAATGRNSNPDSRTTCFTAGIASSLCGESRLSKGVHRVVGRSESPSRVSAANPCQARNSPPFGESSCLARICPFAKSRRVFQPFSSCRVSLRLISRLSRKSRAAAASVTRTHFHGCHCPARAPQQARFPRKLLPRAGARLARRSAAPKPPCVTSAPGCRPNTSSSAAM